MCLVLTLDEMEQLVKDVEKLNINDKRTKLAIKTIKSYADDGYDMQDLKDSVDVSSSTPPEDKHGFYFSQLIYEEYLTAQAMIEHLQEILIEER